MSKRTGQEEEKPPASSADTGDMGQGSFEESLSGEGTAPAVRDPKKVPIPSPPD